MVKSLNPFRMMIDDYHHIAWGVAQLRTQAHSWHAPLHRVTERAETSPRNAERTPPPGAGWVGRWDGITRRRGGARSVALSPLRRRRCYRHATQKQTSATDEAPLQRHTLTNRYTPCDTGLHGTAATMVLSFTFWTSGSQRLPQWHGRQ